MKIYSRKFNPGVSLSALLIATSAFAADLPSQKEAPAAGDPWGGFYVGGHMAFAFSQTQWTANSNIPPSGTAPVVAHDGQTGPIVGGFQAGYNFMLNSHWVISGEADITFRNIMASSQTALNGAVTTDDMEFFADLRARFGYASGNWLFYGLIGPAISHEQLNLADAFTSDQTYFTRWGLVAGAGVEVRLSPDWSLRGEYNFDYFPRSSLNLPNAGQSYSSNLAIQSVGFGLNYHFGADENAPGALPNMDNFSIHGQTTSIYQSSLPLYALYSGLQSLGPGFNARDTISTTAYIGYRIMPGTEIYYNPEPFQGFGLSGTHGLAGFTNNEAQKAGFLFPHYNTSRLFVRQTFGLGGEQEETEDGFNQFAGKQDISRVTVTVGRMSVTDIFDTNTYAHDGRTQFMNWVLVDAGAFDYAADQKGYTWGAVVELNQKDWAARYGYFLEGSEPNGNNFNTSFGKGQSILELEGRYNLFEKAGKLRVAGWYADGVAGNFDQAVALYNANPTTDVNDYIQQTWQHRAEYGVYANLEQSVTDDLAVFSRASWRSGHTQIMAWTDIDMAISAGAVLKGTAWGRPQDNIGLAGVINGINQSYQNFLAVGGLGINIGDGALSYTGEKIIETYYAYTLNKNSAVSLDYQFVGAPGYNSVRGPANIISARYHAQF